MVTPANDETWLARALLGSGADYAEALGHLSRVLRPYVTKRIARKEDSEDILQEILLSVHRARHTYDGRRPLMPWVYAIARYRLGDYLRNYYAEGLNTMIEIGEIENSLAHAVTPAPSFYESIQGEIAALPGKQPAILKLLHGDGYTSRQVAEQMGMKETAVKVAAHRAYKTLKKKLVSMP